MQGEFDEHLPSAKVQIVGINRLGDEGSNPDMAAKSDLPLLQDVANGDGASEVWTDYNTTWRDVRVVDGDGEMSDVIINLSSDDLRTAATYEQVKADIRAFVTRNNTAQSDYQNATEPYDVTNDGFVVPQDLLAVVNDINTNQSRELTGDMPNFLDVDGDGWNAPRDAWLLVNHLNKFSDDGSSEPPDSSAATDAVFAALQAAAEQDDDDDS